MRRPVASLGQSTTPPRAPPPSAERAFLAVLGAGCRLPIGAHAIVTGETLKLHAVIADEAGTLHRGDSTGAVKTAKHIGQGLAWRLKLEAGI